MNGADIGVSGIAERIRLKGALSVYPALFNALILNLNDTETGYLSEGFSLII